MSDAKNEIPFLRYSMLFLCSIIWLLYAYLLHLFR